MRGWKMRVLAAEPILTPQVSLGKSYNRILSPAAAYLFFVTLSVSHRRYLGNPATTGKTIISGVS